MVVVIKITKELDRGKCFINILKVVNDNECFKFIPCRSSSSKNLKSWQNVWKHIRFYRHKRFQKIFTKFEERIASASVFFIVKTSKHVKKTFKRYVEKILTIGEKHYVFMKDSKTFMYDRILIREREKYFLL